MGQSLITVVQPDREAWRRSTLCSPGSWWPWPCPTVAARVAAEPDPSTDPNGVPRRPNRRQMFYGLLMSNVRARPPKCGLFGLGDFLRGRMVRETVFHQPHDAVLRTGGSSAPRAPCRCWRRSSARRGLIWGGPREAATGKAGKIGDVALFIAAGRGRAGAGISRHGRPAWHRVYQSLDPCSAHFGGRGLGRPRTCPSPRRRGAAARAARRGSSSGDVWFRYDIGLPWVLRGVVRHGTSRPAKSVALIGLNGAGEDQPGQVALPGCMTRKRGGHLLGRRRHQGPVPGRSQGRAIGTVVPGLHDLRPDRRGKTIGMGGPRPGSMTGPRSAMPRRRRASTARLSALPRGYDTNAQPGLLRAQGQGGPGDRGGALGRPVAAGGGGPRA